MTYGEKLETIFNSSFGDNTQEALIRCLFDAYKISYQKCFKEYHYHEAHDLLPFLRWVNFRNLIRGLDARFNEIETSAKPNGSASSFHIRINAGSVILTVSSVNNPWSLPRPASHRKEYANQNNQLKLEFTGKENLPKDSMVYSILTHGAKHDDKSLPGFARIVFPAEDYECIIHRIDLFEKYSDLVKNLSGIYTPEEDRKEPVRRKAEPKIKKEII